MQIVVFELGEEKYAIETSKVQGINKMVDITKVPCAPTFIKGLINLRGNIISVVDPYTILGIEDLNKQAQNIVIIETDDEILGIIVDKVIEVIEVESSQLKNISISKDDDRKYIKGTVNLGDYLVTLIDMEILLSA